MKLQLLMNISYLKKKTEYTNLMKQISTEDINQYWKAIEHNFLKSMFIEYTLEILNSKILCRMMK